MNAKFVGAVDLMSLFDPNFHVDECGAPKPLREDLVRESTFSFGHCPN